VIRSCEVRTKGTGLSLELRVDTFLLIRWHFQLATLGNLDCLLGLVSSTLCDVLDLVDDLIVALEDFAEYDVTSIQPRSDSRGDKELQ
jgi:hypothetical protein